jgi:TRAP transporter TAXI family solute receptor
MPGAPGRFFKGGRTMNRFSAFRTISAGVIVAGAVAAAMPASAQQAVRLGTSSVGSTFYVVAVAMSKLIHAHGGFNVTVEPLGGSHANMFGIQRNKVDFAIANSGAGFDAYNGVKPFKKAVNVRLVAQGNPTLRWPMSRKGAGIKSAKDWVGKTISSKRRPLPELELIANAIIKVYGLPKGKINQVSSVNLGEVNRAVRAGSVDAAVMPFGLRQPVTSKLFHDNLFEPLMMSEETFRKVKAALPDKFYAFKVPANNFENQPEAFWSLAMNTLLTTGANVSDDVVYKTTKAILGNNAEFKKYLKAARYWTAKRSMDEPKIPFHPGAIRYYKEAGVWNADMDKLQARLLAKK